MVGDVRGFEPHHILPSNYLYLRAVYNTLTRYDDTMTVRPELAESWDLTPNGRDLTMKLRQGVRFHSGRPFDARAVQFNLERVRRQEIAANVAPLAARVAEIATPDDRTVTLRFERPNPAVFDLFDSLYIMDPDSADVEQRGAGTGPFRLEEWVPGSHARLVRFPEHWRPERPYVDELVLRSIPDTFGLATSLEARALDAAWSLSYRDAARLNGTDGIAVDQGRGNFYFDVIFKLAEPPFADRRVRQAINHAVNREQFVRGALAGQSRPTCVPLAPSSWAYDPALEARFPFDLERARQLLAEAGLSEGFETVITTSSKRTPGLGNLAQILQADLKKIGVDARIEDLEPAVYSEKFRKREFKILLQTYGFANKDPDSLFSVAIAWHPRGNPAGFQSEEYARLAVEGASVVDRQQRLETYRQLLTLAMEESFVIPVAQQPALTAIRPHVRGFSTSLDSMPQWGEAWLA